MPTPDAEIILMRATFPFGLLNAIDTSQAGARDDSFSGLTQTLLSACPFSMSVPIIQTLSLDPP